MHTRRASPTSTVETIKTARVVAKFKIPRNATGIVYRSERGCKTVYLIAFPQTLRGGGKIDCFFYTTEEPETCRGKDVVAQLLIKRERFSGGDFRLSFRMVCTTDPITRKVWVLRRGPSPVPSEWIVIPAQTGSAAAVAIVPPDATHPAP